jgi:hypothetical protein
MTQLLQLLPTNKVTDDHYSNQLAANVTLCTHQIETDSLLQDVAFIPCPFEMLDLSSTSKSLGEVLKIGAL